QRVEGYYPASGKHLTPCGVPQIAERGLSTGEINGSRSNQPVLDTPATEWGPFHSAGGRFLFLQRLPALHSEDKRGRDDFGLDGGYALRLFLDRFCSGFVAL